MSVFSWRSTSWIRNIWTSAVVALVAVQISWLVIGGLKGFTVADTVLKDYMWYVLGLLYFIFLAVRAPKPASTSDSENVSRSDGDS